MNLSNRPDLKALKQLLKEVGHLNLFYKIMQSEDDHALKSNVSYAIKTLSKEAEGLGEKNLESDLRKYALEVRQSDIRQRLLQLIDELFDTGIIEKMTEAQLNKRKSYPAFRFFEQRSRQQTQQKRHSTFDFSSMTSKALSRG